MGKPCVLVYLCTGKECRKVWRRQSDLPPGKWLKRHAAAAELPYRLKLIKTECMDRCEEAANVCVVHGDRARLVSELRLRDGPRLLAACMACVEDKTQP